MTSPKWSRRDLLRFGSAAVFLSPVLRASRAHAQVTAHPRYVQVFIPNGCRPRAFYPDAGPDERVFDFAGTILEPLNPLRGKVSLYRDVTTVTRFNIHSMVPRLFTNGTNRDGRSDGASLDWRIADHLRAQGVQTRFHSLHLGVDSPFPSSGGRCTPVCNPSGQPQPLETDPGRAFDGLFSDLTGSMDARCAPEAIAARRTRRSVLDAHRRELSAAVSALGLTAEERVVLDEYETGVRELEQRLAPDPDCSGANAGAPPELEALGGRTLGAPTAEHGRLMAEIITWAFRLDLTRVASLNFFSEGGDTDGGRRRNIDVASWFRVRDGVYHPEGERVDTFHHHLSHFGDSSREARWHAAVNRWAVDAIAHLAQGLDAVPTADGSLLDASTILYMSSGGDGSRHRGEHSPCVLVGGANGRIPMGRYRNLDGRVYHGSALRSVADAFGLPGDGFGSNPDDRPIVRLW